MLQTTNMPPQNPNASTEKPEHQQKKREHSNPLETNITCSSSEITNHSAESNNLKSVEESMSPDSSSAQINNNQVDCRKKGGGSVDNGRERMKRHRVEVAGPVWIPDMWGQEGLLMDWIDCTAFDASLMNSSIMSARAALVEEAGRTRTVANPTAVPRVLRLENSC